MAERATAATIAKPRTAIDILRDNRLITPREHEAALYLQALDRRLWLGGREPRVELLVRSIRDDLDAIEIDLWPLLRLVLFSHKLPRTHAGHRRLREALQWVAYRIDAIQALLEDCAGTA